MKRIFTAATLIAAAALAGSANAAVVYFEDFEDASSNTMASVGWTAVKSDGTALTNEFGVTTSDVLEGSKSAFWSGSWAPVWAVSDAPAITDPIEEVSWLVNSTAATFRLGLEVGGTWYLSGTLNAAAAPGAITVDDFSGFAAWSGAPINDSTGWDATFTGTLGTPGALPSGTVTRVGLMGVDNLSIRVDNFTVSTVPEPGSLALLGLGGLMMLKRRRRG